MTQFDHPRFDVRGTLGSGGAGIVYRVLDRELGREVALKLLRKASGRDLYRFKREFRTLADIVHPNLVALHELHATAANDWYITMELVEGVSFIDFVRPGATVGPSRTRVDIHDGVLDEQRLRDGLLQLADALHALHLAGKLHRDLKPSNVMVTPEGRLVLLDFGLILAVAEGGREGLAVGTPVYMSPEQASDQALGPASDWYGVGAMLYEALTGRRPFEGDSEQVMTRKQRELPRSPLDLNAKAPADLAALAIQLLAPRVSARATAKAVFDTLGSAPSASALANAKAPPIEMIGRELELAALERALADAEHGGTAMLVRGKSGIGKSLLVRTFLERQGEAVFVVAGRCFEREAVPFKMLDGVVDALTGVILTLPSIEVAGIVPPEIGSLVRMFPVLRRVEQLSELVGTLVVPVDPQELRRRGFRGLATLLGRLAQLRPLILVVDDAHWGDADSATFLAQLVHEPQKRVLVIAAHRPEDYLGVIATLRRPPGGTARPGDLRELEIAALDDVAAAKLVALLAGDHQERASIALAAAAGNPLVLSEMTRAPALSPGMRIEDLVRERATRLPLDAQALLAITSVAARPLSVEIAALASQVLRDDSFRLQDASLMIAAANIDLYIGDPAMAFSRIEAAWGQLEQIGCLRLQQPRIELALLRARVLLALGGVERRREARIHAELMIKEGAPWATGLGHLIHASVHAFAGGDEAARAELLAGEEHLMSAGMLGYLQIARLRRGAIEGGAIGAARSATAREVLGGLGAVDTDQMIRYLVPWPDPRYDI